jgi:hypothetical protein
VHIRFAPASASPLVHHRYYQINGVNFIGVCPMGFATPANSHKKPIWAVQLFDASEAIFESIGTHADP